MLHRDWHISTTPLFALNEDGEKRDQIISERNIFKWAFHVQFEYTNVTFIHTAEIQDGMRV